VIVDAGFLTEWSIKGHNYGQCMHNAKKDLMYVNIPKNASSWTKPNLLDFGWTEGNYHTGGYEAHAIVALRDPVDRWLSGIAEYFALYHPAFDTWNTNVFDLIFERVCFDDHTEHQIKFIHKLDKDNCTFLKCDDTYSSKYSRVIQDHYGNNKYDRYDRQHVRDKDTVLRSFKKIFESQIQNSKYLNQIQNYFEADYHLINSVKFYDPR